MAPVVLLALVAASPAYLQCVDVAQADVREPLTGDDVAAPPSADVAREVCAVLARTGALARGRVFGANHPRFRERTPVADHVFVSIVEADYGNRRTGRLVWLVLRHGAWRVERTSRFLGHAELPARTSYAVAARLLDLVDGTATPRGPRQVFANPLGYVVKFVHVDRRRAFVVVSRAFVVTDFAFLCAYGRCDRPEP
jgi:hypothetical protein